MPTEPTGSRPAGRPLAQTGDGPGAIWRNASLRTRVALVVALPLLLSLFGFSLAHYLSERHLLEDQLHTTAAQLGEVMAGGLRHAMLHNDRSMLQDVLRDIAGMESIERVQIVNAGGVVRFDTSQQAVGEAQSTTNPGCTGCHEQPAVSSAQGDPALDPGRHASHRHTDRQ